MSPKKYEDYFRSLICDGSYTLKNIVEYASAAKNLGVLKNNLLHFHEIVDTNRYAYRYLLLNEIIRNKHPNLYEDLMQIFETNPNGIRFYQCRLSKQSRLIFTIVQNEQTECFIPLILDLNHVIYIKDDKSYDDNKKFNNFCWDFREEQEKIKKYLININS